MKNAKTLVQVEWKRRKNPGYYREIDRACTFIVPEGVRVLELGCATGRLLAATRPCYGLGIDIDEKKIAAAQQIHSGQENLEFRVGDVEETGFSGEEPFDYIIISDLLSVLRDVQKTLVGLHSVCAPYTRLIITYHSNVWRPVLALATLLGRRSPDPSYNWLSTHDIENLLSLSGFEEVTHSGRTLLPVQIPGLSWIMNRFLAKMPMFNWFCLTWVLVARPCPAVGPAKGKRDEPTVSVLVPTRNEKGNIEAAFTQTPKMGKWTELVFVDGNSDDGTVEEIERCIEQYSAQWHRALLLRQSGKGKGQAVRQGFAECEGEILMILDSDLTMPPDELPKYYEAIVSGKGEFINGCRLVYPMEKKAMRFLNMIANHFLPACSPGCWDRGSRTPSAGPKCCGGVIMRKSRRIVRISEILTHSEILTFFLAHLVLTTRLLICRFAIVSGATVKSKSADGGTACCFYA